MKNKAIFHVFCLFLTLLVPITAHAQQCDLIAEEIITLREPIYRTPMVWSARYGQEDGMDQITDLVTAHVGGDESNEIIVAGNYTAGEKDQILKPFLSRLDKNGKVIWENRQKSSQLKTAQRLLKIKNGYAVLGDIKEGKKGNGFHVTLYAKDGTRISGRSVFGSDVDLIAKGFVETKDKNGFIIAAERVARNDDENREAVLYRVNNSGLIIWQRKYSPGLKTSFNNVQRLSDGRYIVSGQIEQSNGRMAAWLISVNESGAINWQRQYPRGSSASLDHAALLPDQSIIVSGVVKPLRGTQKSGWVMKIGPSGTPLWQRYYSGAYAYEVKNIIVEEDGRISALLHGFPAKGGKEVAERRRGHARILTLSPRGYLLNSESFSDAQHAFAARLMRGDNQNRLVVGTIQDNVPDGLEQGDNMSFVFDGWIFAATSLDPYQDPCL